MIARALAREIVQRDRIAVPCPIGLRRLARRPGLLWIGQIPGGEKIDSVGIAGTGAVGLAPDVVGPIDHTPAGDLRLQPHGHRGAVWLPFELVIAHPLQADGTAVSGAREQGCVESHVVGAVLAIASRPLVMDAVDR